MDLKIEKKLSFVKTILIRIWIVLIVSFTLVLFIFIPFLTKEVENGASLEMFIAHLDKRIPNLMEKYSIPGVNTAIVREGEIVWSKAYGYADIDAGREMTTDTYLRVESISKSVTAWGVMKLVEQDKIDLDASISQYLPEWSFPESKFPGQNITVRQLLSHRAGLSLGDFTQRYSPEQQIPSLKDYLLKEAVLQQEPGVSFSYSNIGFELLELLIEEVTGQDFEKYMEGEILTPLGMNNSSFVWSQEFHPAVPYGYDLKGKAVPVYIYPGKGSGGLFATVEDIAAFVAAGMPNFSKSNQVLSTQSINKLYTSEAENLGVYSIVFDSYGLGYYIEKLSEGNIAVSHGGQGAGWMTHFHSVPEIGDGIVILTNSQRSWPFIACILRDWAGWIGVSSLGMGNIVTGNYVLWILIGLIWCILMWQIWRLGYEMVFDRRKLAIHLKGSRPLKLLQIVVGIILIFGLLWCINQDYLLISSVFPIASRWLAISVFATSLVLLLSAFTLKESKEKEESGSLKTFQT